MMQASGLRVDCPVAAVDTDREVFDDGERH